MNVSFSSSGLIGAAVASKYSAGRRNACASGEPLT